LGYTFRFKIADFRLSGLGLLLFGLVGIPIGLGTGFLQFNANFPNVNGFAFALIGGYLLIALPEELLFKGIIQNILTRQVRNERLGLGIAAVIFGLSHLNNSTPGFPTPNWMYAGMAALAGLAYGWVWQRTGKVTASAITHALVNLLWGILLS